MNYNELFTKESCDAIQAFYDSYEPCHALLHNYRRLKGRVGHVQNIFYGDSITAGWPLHEFFPNASVLNRGIGGDNASGLYLRMSEDVFPYTPKRVFMLIGINGINAPNERLLAQISTLATIMKERDIDVFLSSVLPLRSPDKWDRFQYQGKIVELNGMLRQWAESHSCGFMDYHSALKDDTGQLAAEYALPNGTLVLFAAYEVMSELVRPYLA